MITVTLWKLFWSFLFIFVMTLGISTIAGEVPEWALIILTVLLIGVVLSLMLLGLSFIWIGA